MALIKILRQACGQSTLEAAVSLPILFLSLFFIAAGLYGVFLQSVLHHQTYEYLLCAEFSEALSCEEHLKNKIAAAVPLGKWQLKIPPPTQNIRHVQIHFSFPLYGKHVWNWNYQNQIKRDLSSSSF